jgi:hypothetical protein
MPSTLAARSLADEVDVLMSPGHPDRAAIRDNPYPLYARLRAESPAFYHKTSNTWLFASHAACRQALLSPDITTGIVERWQREAGDVRWSSARRSSSSPTACSGAIHLSTLGCAPWCGAHSGRPRSTD